MALHDLLVDAHRVLIPKGGLADKHFVDEDTECPPVDGCSVTSVANDFRCEILGRATEGVGDALAMVGVGRGWCCGGSGVSF